MKQLVIAVLLFSALALFAGETSDMQVKEIDSFWYAAVEMKGSYEQHQQAFQTLYEQAGMQGLGTDFPSFGIYYDDPSQVTEDELTWEIGLKLEEKTEIKEPLVLKEWNHTLVASTIYTGSFSSQDFGAAHEKLFQWVMENGYSPAGPMMEKYMDMPTQNSDGEWEGTINIILPVAKN